MKLSEIKAGLALSGLEPEKVCTVLAATFLAEDALQVVYSLPDGTAKVRLLGSIEEPALSVAESDRPLTFEGDPAAFQLACEAKRINLAFLFDPMMAVHTSNVDPLPHQITAVYESMLPRQPLRFVLADDPGAGKTVMAGLYIRELVVRADARRVLIVAPGSLVDQWREELFNKFGLEFQVFANSSVSTTPSGNPFEDHNQMIVRLDQMARNEELQQKLCAAGWDLVIFDEAHKLAAHYFGSKLEKTGRFQLAERLGGETRHLLLMTATPHNGKEEDFQLFLSLLDSDRFYGKFRDGVHKVDTSDLMRRMVKEELVKFDNTPLFPERRAYTVNYRLSNLEAALYESVTEYVQTEMGKADDLDGKRKSSVGFALTALQRRLASSPEAIYQSLKRRRKRLADRVREEKLGIRGRQFLAETVPSVPEDDDDLNADEQETLEESLVDDASAAKSVAELESEILILTDLENRAKEVVLSGQDRKWDELSKLLQNNPEMHDADGRQRKIIIFSEHRDTLNYLHAKIAGVLGSQDAVVVIHGGTKRDDRLKVQSLFRSEKDVRVLIATDAAGEGVNLQCANLMVNYDLPWNPNRMEQRFGRIHRIGQTEVCHLWSLVAKETREGAVYHRLLEKLATECEALKGKVFNVLGDVFEEKSLKELIIEAIRYGDQPEIRARLSKRIDSAFDHEHLKDLLHRNALNEQTMSADQLFAIKEEMERAEARKLQPYFVRSFFMKAFDSLGGAIYGRESERYEVTRVPMEIRERDRRITGRNRREQEPVLKRYDRVCFDRAFIKPTDKPGLARAELIHPGHPLMLSVTDLILEKNANLLRQGAIFVDKQDDQMEPWVLFLLTHEVKSSDGLVISKRIQFIKVSPEGSASFAGWAPHLDLEPLLASDRPRMQELLKSSWINSELEQKAIGYAASALVPEHYREIANRRVQHVDRTLKAVHERLTKEIDFWSDREIRLKEDKAAGKDVRLQIENVSRTLQDLQYRLESRKRELQAMRQVQNGSPIILGCALVVPAGLLMEIRGESPALGTPDATARAKIEKIAMQAVMEREISKGHEVKDVSAEKCGWDITSHPPRVHGVQAEPIHIEVKGRAAGADTITVTHNEITCALNQADKFILAIVFVNPDDSVDGPHYIPNPFRKEPDWGAASVNYSIEQLLSLGRQNS
jgi:superfamily II DNA or RNA helicase